MLCCTGSVDDFPSEQGLSSPLRHLHHSRLLLIFQNDFLVFGRRWQQHATTVVPRELLYGQAWFQRYSRSLRAAFLSAQISQKQFFIVCSWLGGNWMQKQTDMSWAASMNFNDIFTCQVTILPSHRRTQMAAKFFETLVQASLVLLQLSPTSTPLSVRFRKKNLLQTCTKVPSPQNSHGNGWRVRAAWVTAPANAIMAKRPFFNSAVRIFFWPSSSLGKRLVRP